MEKNTLISATDGLKRWINLCYSGIIQYFYTAASAFFDKRIQTNKKSRQTTYRTSERWFAYSHLFSQLSAYTGERRGEASLVRDTVRD